MFRPVDEQVRYRGPYLTIVGATFEAPDGEQFTREFIRHPGAVAAVPVIDDEVVLVRQFRAPLGRDLLEIPAGLLDVAGEPAEAAIARELEEEAGLRAGSWRKLGEFFSAPGFTDELMHLYLATDLTPADPDGRLGPDEDERLILEWRPWQEAVALAETGGIRDAKSIVGLFWLARLMAEGSPL
jgi:ADP-ribose pyrophosphatase